MLGADREIHDVASLTLSCTPSGLALELLGDLLDRVRVAGLNLFGVSRGVRARIQKHDLHDFLLQGSRLDYPDSAYGALCITPLEAGLDSLFLFVEPLPGRFRMSFGPQLDALILPKK